MNPDERRRKLAAERARQDICEILAELYGHGLDMGEISCLVLDELISYFTGINAIRRVINEREP